MQHQMPSEVSSSLLKKKMSYSLYHDYHTMLISNMTKIYFTCVLGNILIFSKQNLNVNKPVSGNVKVTHVACAFNVINHK